MLINSTDMLHLPPSVTGLRHFPTKLIFLTLLLAINGTMQLQKHFPSNRYWDPVVYLLQLINSVNIDISMLKPLNNFMGFKTGHIVGNNAEGRILKQVFQKNEARQIFRKTNISYPLIRTRKYHTFPLRISNRVSRETIFYNEHSKNPVASLLW